MTKAQQKEQERQESIQVLRKTINKKQGIVIVIKSVSKSGMSRRMDVYTRDLNNYISYHVAKVLDWPFNDRGIKVDGCGMDMAFHLAYTLTSYLYSKEEREKLTGNGQGTIPWKTL